MQNEEGLVEAPFNLTSLDEAATMSLEDITESFERCCYLDQVYSMIQKNMRDKQWRPLTPETFAKWEDNLWYWFITKQNELSEYLPGGDIGGWTMHSKLWIVLGGLHLMNHCWRPIPPWRKLYNERGTGLHLPWIAGQHFVYDVAPINTCDQNTLLGHLFTLTTRLYDSDYHPELEYWVRWLQTRTFEITYIVTTRDLFNTFEFCGPRPKSSTLYGVSDSFVQETSRLFAEFRGALYRYNSYGRLSVSCSAEGMYMRERPMTEIIADKLELPISPLQETSYISGFFFSDPDVDGPILRERWGKWVTKNLSQYYHERSRMLLQKEGLVQALRPGEIARCKANNMGIPPGYYEILKKCRPLRQLDHLDHHAFRVSKETVLANCADLDRSPHRIKDAALLYLVNQYMHHNLQIRFTALFVRQEHQWCNDFDDLEKQDHPILLQTVGGWDVYCNGEIYQARNMARAFLIWCYKIANRYKGYVFGHVYIMDMLKELLLDETAERPKEPVENQPTSSSEDVYWM